MQCILFTRCIHLAYTMAPNAGTLKLLRVVVREDFSRHRCEIFIRDLHEVPFPRSILEFD
jgi:hypothetical protein